jgi:hypothetical protein
MPAEAPVTTTTLPAYAAPLTRVSFPLAPSVEAYPSGGRGCVGGSGRLLCASMTGPTVSVKGFALRGLLRSIKDNGWAIPAVIAAVPEAQRATFAKAIVVSAWYPYGAFVALTHALERLHGEGPDFALSRRIGRESAARDLGTTFRIISAMASVDFLLKRGQVFWEKYCDRGRMVLAAPHALSFVARMEDFPEVDPAHCRLIEGWLEGLGEALGAVDMACRQTRCVNRGDPVCEYLGEWTSQRGLFH